MPRVVKTAICLFCEKEFSRRPGTNDLMKFCSKSHSTKYRYKDRDTSINSNYQVECTKCGGPCNRANKARVCRECLKKDN